MTPALKQAIADGGVLGLVRGAVGALCEIHERLADIRDALKARRAAACEHRQPFEDGIAVCLLPQGHGGAHRGTVVSW